MVSYRGERIKLGALCWPFDAAADRGGGGGRLTLASALEQRLSPASLLDAARDELGAARWHVRRLHL